MKDGGPAFPAWDRGGMSLRDYFAGQALPGLVTCEPVADEADSDAPARQVAKDAYRIADAMLAERDREI